MDLRRIRPGWTAYAAVLTFTVVAGEVARGERPGAVALASWVLSAALLTALWCYALQHRLGNVRYWRTVFWLVLVANVLMLVPVLMLGGAVALATAGLTALIVPAYVAAWSYAYRSPALWDSGDEPSAASL